jgi:Tfp pilus assembly protein PilF
MPIFRENNMKEIFLKINFFIVFLFFCNPLIAAPYTPASPEVVIASWGMKGIFSKKSNNSQENPLVTIRELIIQAKKPGNSYLYSIAESKLENFIKENRPPNDEIWLLQAQIQQYNHRFDNAKKSLEKALELNATNETALLMLSRIYILQKDFDNAKRTCTRLLGQSDITTASVCLLEAESHLGNLQDSYTQLKQLAESTTFNAGQYKNWVYLLLASMSERLQQPYASGYWLDKGFDTQSLSFITHWADNKLALGKYSEVNSVLSAIVNKTDYTEDAILLRLAISEKFTTQNNNKLWHKKIKARIEHRERRQDTLHADDIARYYIEVSPNPKKALKWAKTNWAQAQEYKDKQLLDKAIELSREQS